LKTFTSLCSKFIKQTVRQISSESVKVYRRYNKNIWAYFLIAHYNLFVVLFLVHCIIIKLVSKQQFLHFNWTQCCLQPVQ